MSVLIEPEPSSVNRMKEFLPINQWKKNPDVSTLICEIQILLEDFHAVKMDQVNNMLSMQLWSFENQYSLSSRRTPNENGAVEPDAGALVQKRLF